MLWLLVSVVSVTVRLSLSASSFNVNCYQKLINTYLRLSLQNRQNAKFASFATSPFFFFVANVSLVSAHERNF